MNKFVLAAALLAAFSAQAAMAASVEAFDNRTIQPAGPRSGNNGINFFNIEGADYGNFASYGVVRFDLAAMKAGFDATHGVGGWKVDSVVLRLTQSNAAFTNDGGVDVHFSDIDTPDFLAMGLQYGFAGDFPDAVKVMGYRFSEVSTGSVENHALFNAAGTYSAGGLALAADILADNVVTLALVDADTSVAATYAGFNHNTYAGPTLEVTVAAVPEPETWAMLLMGLGLVGLVARRDRRGQATVINP
jgi:hypothetical protein